MDARAARSSELHVFQLCKVHTHCGVDIINSNLRGIGPTEPS